MKRLLLVCLGALQMQGAAIVYSVGGDTTPGSISPTIDTFRSDIGGANNGTTPGPIATGRREITWDGVPDAASSPNNLSATAFQNRGVTFLTPGTGFQVSAKASSGVTVEFGNLTPGLEANLAAFSTERLFAPLGSVVTDVLFNQPGALTLPATVSAFGVVFTDVDLAGETRMEFFGSGGASLGAFDVPVGTAIDQSFSFLGVRFDAGERVSRVRITTGLDPVDLGVIGADFVAMDDWVYSEPQAIPEPGSLLMSAGALLAVVIQRRRRCLRS
jgi:hypothetical protein